MAQRKPITLDTVVRGIITLAIVGVCVWLVDILSGVLLPFCVACLIAYILDPVVDFQQRVLHLRHRIIPVFLTLLETSIVVGTIAYFFIPSALKEFDQLQILVKASSAKELMPSFLPPALQEYLLKYLDPDNLTQLLNGTRLEAVLNKSTDVLTATVDFLLHTIEWLLTFIYVIFILIDYKRIMRGFRLAVPPKYRERTYPILDNIKTNMDVYFRSQAVIALCAAVFYCIGFTIVGLPMAIVMGITVGILYMIPYFQYITLIPVAVICFVTSLTGAFEFWPELGKCLAVYVVSQCICDYILTPKIMGKTLGMNPAIILLSLSIWGTLLGILGMIIALPVTALLISYYKQYVLTPDQDSDSQPVTPADPQS
ncbi:MAG: AI-2E family transporter [Muribaculaceae bacterium]|nr:AI-2E family transporter [Muribaculaceae bacterium]